MQDIWDIYNFNLVPQGGSQSFSGQLSAFSSQLLGVLGSPATSNFISAAQY